MSRDTLNKALQNGLLQRVVQGHSEKLRLLKEETLKEKIAKVEKDLTKQDEIMKIIKEYEEGAKPLKDKHSKAKEALDKANDELAAHYHEHKAKLKKAGAKHEIIPYHDQPVNPYYATSAVKGY